MAHSTRYAVFRYYSPKEAPTIDYRDRVVFYGWTDHKSVMKAFLAQRNSKKYIVKRMDRDEVENMVEHGDHMELDDPEHRIDIIQLPSKNLEAKIDIFMTEYEMKEVEKDIQSRMRSYASVDAYDKYTLEDMYTLVNMFVNLEEPYQDILYYLGFRPIELDMLDESEDGYTIMDQIDAGYANRRHCTFTNPRGVSHLQDDYTKTLYSMENFIKSMIRDM